MEMVKAGHWGVQGPLEIGNGREAIGMVVIIKPKRPVTTTCDPAPGGVAEDDAPDRTDAPDPDDDLLGIPPFLDRRGEAMNDDHA